MKSSQINLQQIKLYGALDADSFRKIFPQEYFQKFAAHLKVLDFEKKLFQLPPEPSKLKFIKRTKSLTLNPHETKPKTNLNKFAKIADTILNDKQQIIRLKEISKKLQENVKCSETQSALLKKKHSNEIRTIKNTHQVQMKLIDTMMIDSTRQTEEKIKQKLENIKRKEIFCNFVKRSSQREGIYACKSKLMWSDMKKYNSEKKIAPAKNDFNSHQVFKIPFEKSLLLQDQTKTKTKNSENSLYLKIPTQMNNEKSLVRSRTNSSMNSIFKGTNTLFKRTKSSKKLNFVEKSQAKIDLIEQTKKLKQNKDLLKKILMSQQIGNLSWKKLVTNNQAILNISDNKAHFLRT